MRLWIKQVDYRKLGTILLRLRLPKIELLIWILLQTGCEGPFSQKKKTQDQSMKI